MASVTFPATSMVPIGSFVRLTSFILSTSPWTTVTGHMQHSKTMTHTQLLAFRRSKNRLVDRRFAVRKSFRFSISVLCIESNFFANSNDAMITIQLTILDLDLKLQMALFGCIFPGGEVDSSCTSCSFHRVFYVFLAQAYL